MNIWWVVGSERDPNWGWHWREFFENPYEDGPECHWGGSEWIRSSFSHKRIEEMRRRDLVVAYQAQEGIRGLASLAADGYRSEPRSPYDKFALRPDPIVYLNEPVP